MSLVRDSRYSSSSITKALTSAFSSTLSLFNLPVQGTKLAIVATKNKDSSTCIFTNYNRLRACSLNCSK